jgi:RNA polymerase sigma-70 factor (ECF subfamily)
VVQEVYVRAWQRLPELRDPAAFGGWLRQVAVRVILRWRERSSRRGRREESSSSPPQGADTGGTRIDLRVDLERAVARLPPQARKVFVLYDIEGWPHLEIAEFLGISHHTSRSQLHRARALLKRFLLEKEEA